MLPIEQIKRVFDETPTVRLAVLFGSAARQRASRVRNPRRQPGPVGALKGAECTCQDLNGNPAYREWKEFDPARPAVGRKIRVVFKDGELLIGTTQTYQPGRPGFFVIPADPGSNNERCFVVASAVKNVAFI